MPTTCSICGALLNPAGRTHISKKCATCRQTESIEKAESRRMREEKQRSQREQREEVLSRTQKSTSGSDAGQDGGCAKPLLVIALIAAGGYWGWGKLKPWFDSEGRSVSDFAGAVKDKAQEVGSKLENSVRSSPKESTEGAASPDDAPIVRESPKAPDRSALNELSNFERIAFPVNVVLLDSIKLLDSAGAETEIPQGSSFAIIGRSESGILTVEFKGAIYMGHEERVAGKARRR